MTPLKTRVLRLEAPTSHLSVSHFLHGPHMQTILTANPTAIPTFNCPVCNHNVLTGDSIQLLDGKFCHHRCRQFIHRSGRIKDLVKPEGSRIPTPKQREFNIKYVRESVQKLQIKKKLRKANATLGDNSLVDYLDEK